MPSVPTDGCAKYQNQNEIAGPLLSPGLDSGVHMRVELNSLVPALPTMTSVW
jgi:hypothetical protein